MNKKNPKIKFKEKATQDAVEVAMRLGLCQNCENLKTCGFQRKLPVWNCEEYQ